MEKIKWLEWSKESFEKAKKENKPILLDIFGVWCFWCHRMEDTYSDDLVAELINEKFIPIKVDTDKRPDVNERYNQGGWPTTAFLAPSGHIITGATYVPHPQFVRMLYDVSEFYAKHKHEDRDALLAEREKTKTVMSNSEIDEGIATSVVDDLISRYDADNGGFGSEPKFPLPEAVGL